MAALIDVTCEPAAGGFACRVTIRDDRSSSMHTVTVSHADLVRLSPGATIPDDLVRRSFEFLLAHEPKESILGRFDLPVIGRYFPEYERAIRRG